MKKENHFHIYVLLLLFSLAIAVLFTSCNSGNPSVGTSGTGNIVSSQTEPCTGPITEPVTDAVDSDTQGGGNVETEPVLYEVRWAIYDDLIRTYCEVGTVPVPPEKATSDIVTVSQIFHFVGWDKEITAVSENQVKYTAQYQSEDRYFNVTLIIDGVESTQSIKYGDEPVVEVPDGKTVLWAEDTSRITSDCTLRGGVFTKGEGIDELEWALRQTPIGFLPSDSQDLQGGGLSSGMALFYLVYLVRQGDENPLFLQRINDHIEHILSGGYEPRFGCCCYWAYGPYSMDFALIRNTPAIWNSLSENRKARADLLMTCFAVASAFGTDDDNNYTTGPDYTGNFSKTWNPNYRLANVIPMISAIAYFGSGDAVNQLLINFDFDTVYAKFTEYGWSRAAKSWGYPSYTQKNGTVTRSAKQLLMEGGSAISLSGSKLGSGIGVKNEYTYLKHTTSDVAGIVNELLSNNYSGGAAVSKITSGGKVVGQILDGTETPVKGRLGMMKEFNSTDGNGKRSSLSYTTYDFTLAEVMLAGVTELGLYKITDYPSISALVTVGNIDFLYKAVHGYGISGTGGGTEIPWGNGVRISAYLRDLGVTGEELE